MDQDPNPNVGSRPVAAPEPPRDEHATADAQVEALRGDMEDTRSQIGETLQALEDRLAPGNLASDAATAVKGQRLMDVLVERIAGFLVELAKSPLDDQFPF